MQKTETFQNVNYPDELTARYRCPCCKYKTLYGRGQDQICQVCFWHDDGQDEHDAETVRGGPNKDLSLRQAQENFARCGAASSLWMANVRAPAPHEE